MRMTPMTMTKTDTRLERPPGGLADLDAVQLSEDRQRLLDSAAAASGGSATWTSRKRAEGHDLLALSQIAPWRLNVRQLTLHEALHAVLEMQVTVPVRESGAPELTIRDRALLGLTYPQEALVRRRRGFAFVQLLSPRGVYHAQVAADPIQPLCLGAWLPAGILVKELVLMSYGALSMQTVMIDERDAAGVMNPDAARWWQQNTDRIPLSRVPFLGLAERSEG